MYVKRYRFITFFSSLSAPFQYLQKHIYDKKVEKIRFEDKPPIFILGHWRSGTTHLHYILSKDEQFGTLSNYQNFLFNVSLLNSTWLKRIVSSFMPEKRPQDNIRLGADKPAEEEQPLSAMSERSGLHSWYFPKNQSYFEKYNLFEGISKEEKLAWQRDYLRCLQYISYANNNKRLLLKNPHNTSRVRELLELFPNAKFITIHRDPKEVFLSTRHLFHAVVSTQFLQHISIREIDELITSNYKQIIEKYNHDKTLIPSGNLFEINYRDLIDHPMHVVQNLYSGLNLDGLDLALPKIRQYLKSVEDFKRNTFSEHQHLSELSIEKFLAEINRDELVVNQ